MIEKKLCQDCGKDHPVAQDCESATGAPTANDLREGKDYYFENGFMVFTREYHLRRGYCCKNDCRHCPYKE